MVARPTEGSGTQWTAINACLVPVAALDGQEVVTAEGLGRPDSLHPVQREMAVRGGSQCGYCTPGFVCSMAAEYYREGRCAPAAATPDPSQNGHERHRPTPRTTPVTRPTTSTGPTASTCTPCRATCAAAPATAPSATRPTRSASPPTTTRMPRGWLPRRPPPAPPGSTARPGTFARPGDLAEALALLAEHPDAVLVAGSTDWGVEVNIRGAAHARSRSASTGCPSCARCRSARTPSRSAPPSA